MAETQQEKKIPVFTVFKKGILFKNIFLLDKNASPSLISDPQSTNSIEPHQKSDTEDKHEEILLVGRHPHCHIMLEHPSISRFHLQLHLQPTLQKLSVVDLSSAHGTWVSDTKIEPQVLVELNEGDVLRLGASTRSYRLHWFPLSRVFDAGNGLVLPGLEKEVASDEENEDNMLKNENLSPSRPPLPEFMNFTLTDDVEEVLPPSLSRSNRGTLSPIVEFDKRSDLSKNLSPSVLLKEDVEGVLSSSLPRDVEGHSPISMSDQWCVPSCLRNSPPVKAISEYGNLRLNDDAEQVFPPTFDHNEEEKHNSIEVLDQSSVLSELSGPLEPKSVSLIVKEPLTTPVYEDLVRPDEKEENMLKDENLISFEQNREPLAPTIPEFGNSMLTNDIEEKVLSCSLPHNEDEKDMQVAGLDEKSDSAVLFVGRVPSEIIVQQFDEENQENAPIISAESVFMDEENQKSPPNRVKEEPSTPPLWSRRGMCDSLLRIKTATSKRKHMEIIEDHGTELKNNAESEDELTPKILSAQTDRRQEIFTPEKEDYSPRTRVGSKSVKKSWRKEINPQTPFESVSSSCDSTSTISEKINLTQIILYDSNMKKRLFGSRRQEARNTPEVPVPTTDTASSRSVNFYQGELSPMVLWEEKSFTPGKENYTPNTGLGLNSIKTGRKREFKLQKSYGSVSSSPNEDKGMLTFSEIENVTPIVLHDRRTTKAISGSAKEADTVTSKSSAERVNSIAQTKSEVPAHLTSLAFSSSVKCEPTLGTTIPVTSKQSRREEREWYIVVDTDSLLNKESRRSLQLLQGLKGTQLIIPRIVIKELDHLKRHGSLFRESIEASKVLQWIEKCMMLSKWWIHIQNSTENHVLDCALSFKKIKMDDRRFVLLNNDIGLKIRAMAEGLLCETVEEFRESLVCPYSERFLWHGSSPRGPTWSFSMESYCGVLVKKTAF